ncbi:MAG: methyltransferase domain-containing protein [Gammaproteobacteria bacterium]|nr:methyltransferase domain-containing protein [Gammaproteobacteria bacterium]
MSFYEKHCLPHIINFACSMKPILRKRQEVVPLASGRVLEVGMGSGLNLPYYNEENVDMVWGLEPSEGMRNKARSRLGDSSIKVEMIDLPGEEIPLEDNSVDTVLLTFTLCTIPDWQKALEQMRRVLKPEGKLIFCEHGKSPDQSVAKWQDRLNPYWNKFAGGCNLNRPMPELISGGGFKIEELEAEYLPGPRPINYFYRGIARQI